MWFGLEKSAKVTFKKGSLAKTKIFTPDINTEITKLEYNKTYEYFGIDEANGINHMIKKKEFYRRIRIIWRTELNTKIKLYVVQSIIFQTIFVQAFKIVVDSWKFGMLLLNILWDDWPIFMLSDTNQQLQQELEYTLLKPDCHSWWISKMQSNSLEELYVIKSCFKLGKKCHVMKAGSTATTQRPRDRVPCGSMLAFRDPRRPDRANPHTNFWWSLFLQHWHDLHALSSHWTDSLQGILCWGFKRVQEEILSEEASTLQIVSVSFPPGQCTSPKPHPCHRLFDQDGHQDSSSPSL